MNNQDTVLPLKRAYQEFVDLIRSLSDEQFLAPMNGWAPRDVTAHLIGWNNFMIEASSTILAGKTPTYYEDAPNDFSTINAGFTAKYASRSKQELLDELKASMERLEAFVLGLPPGELENDHRARHYRGGPATVGKTIVSLAGDYRHHTLEINEWLNKN